MNDILEIIKIVPYIEDCRGRFYKVSDLYKRVKEFKSEIMKVDRDIYMLPFYIDEYGSMYEIYYHELWLRLKEEVEFEQQLLERTGKNISEIPEDIKERIKACDVRISKNEIKKIVLLKFIEHLYEDQTVNKDIEHVFGGVDREKFYLDILWK